LKRSAGADIDIDTDTLEVKTSQSKRAWGAPGRLWDHDSVGHVGMYGVRLLSRARLANIKTMAAVIKWLRGSRLKEGRTRGNCRNSVSFDWRTPPDSKVNVQSWTSGNTQSGSKRGNGGHGRSSGPCEAEVKNLRSKMRRISVHLYYYTLQLAAFFCYPATLINLPSTRVPTLYC
jgi:hypothetical protein